MNGKSTEPLSESKVEQLLIESADIFRQYSQRSVQRGFQESTFLNEMELAYPFISKQYPAVFKISASKNYDYNRLKFMLETMLKVHTGQMTQHQGDVAVGQVLVDQIVKPQLNTKESKK